MSHANDTLADARRNYELTRAVVESNAHDLEIVQASLAKEPPQVRTALLTQIQHRNDFLNLLNLTTAAKIADIRIDITQPEAEPSRPSDPIFSRPRLVADGQPHQVPMSLPAGASILAATWVGDDLPMEPTYTYKNTEHKAPDLSMHYQRTEDLFWRLILVVAPTPDKSQLFATAVADMSYPAYRVRLICLYK